MDIKRRCICSPQQKAPPYPVPFIMPHEPWHTFEVRFAILNDRFCDVCGRSIVAANHCQMCPDWDECDTCLANAGNRALAAAANTRSPGQTLSDLAQLATSLATIVSAFKSSSQPSAARK
ncbi:hypothetical protein DL93DRAFT_1123850 [Clavulina sp. PMI_390]|nr:hypothetical protein DL93DRAFT_1123850 [Clavulina sp. PMI_390]